MIISERTENAIALLHQVDALRAEFINRLPVEHMEMFLEEHVDRLYEATLDYVRLCIDENLTPDGI